MVLVTGAAGLLGRELMKQLLAQGYNVRALYHQSPLPSFPDYSFEQCPCNILDTTGLEDAMQDVEQVYHCAAIVTFNPAQKREMFKINVEGTCNVVNAALNKGVEKMVYVSSVAALGRMRENVSIDENMKWTQETNNSSYGKSKYLAELEVWRGIGEGLKAVIVNPSIILGDGNWNEGSTKIFKTVYEAFPWYSEGISGFVDARDVAVAMIMFMQSDISGERFILSAENRSYREIFNLIAKGFDKKPPYKEVTPLIAKLVWRLEAIKGYFTGKEPLVTRETAASALASVYFDNSKLKHFLPSFQYRGIDETIVHICTAMQQKLNNL